MKKKYYWIVGIVIFIIVLMAGYMLWPKTEILKADIIQKENLTIGELKSTVYQAIKKYVPQSPVGSFEYAARMSNQTPFDSWHYPSREQNYDTTFIYANVYDYHFGMGGPETLENVLSKQNVKTNYYFRRLKNGDVLVYDWNDTYFSRYQYYMTFNCQDKYQIIISTIDYYGSPPYPVFENYDLNRTAMEEMANEILEKC